MFTLCNDLAYNGIMINGGTHHPDVRDDSDRFSTTSASRIEPIEPSQWIDVPASTSGSHLQDNQIAQLKKVLAYLSDNGILSNEVITISPFRVVAKQLDELARNYCGLTAGTIHTAQDKEASVVVLVLSGDPASPGAKAWASATVNLVNVAASRAKRRLYVIGDREAWAKCNYSQQLATSLASTSQRFLERPEK